jgi:hypothetical protein
MLEQTLLLSTDGYTLQAKGSLLPNHWLLHRSVRTDFPILDGIWEELLRLPSEKLPVRFAFVESPHPMLDGFYTLIIKRMPANTKRLEITIRNCTLEAQKRRQALQKRNDALLRQQRIDLMSML